MNYVWKGEERVWKFPVQLFFLYTFVKEEGKMDEGLYGWLTFRSCELELLNTKNLKYWSISGDLIEKSGPFTPFADTRVEEFLREIHVSHLISVVGWMTKVVSVIEWGECDSSILILLILWLVILIGSLNVSFSLFQASLISSRPAYLLPLMHPVRMSTEKYLNGEWLNFVCLIGLWST